MSIANHYESLINYATIVARTSFKGGVLNFRNKLKTNLKKLLIWTFVAALLGGGLLGTLSPVQKAKADEPVDYIGDCTFTANDAGGVKINSFIFAADRKSMTFDVTINGQNEKYNFIYATAGRNPGTGSYTVEYHISRFPNVRFLLIQDLSGDISPSMIYEASDVNANFTQFASNIYDILKSSCVKTDLLGGPIKNQKIDFHGEDAPTITIPAWTAGGRPALTFKLTNTQKPVGWAQNQAIFVFTYQGSDSKYKNLTIRFLTGEGFEITRCVDPSNYAACENKLVSMYFEDAASQKSLWLFYNHVFNPKGSGSTNCDASNLTTFVKADADPAKDQKLANWAVGDTPNEQCLNADPNGWMAKWGVNFAEVSVTNPTGDVPLADTCGVQGSIFTRGIAGVLCSILRSLGAAGQWLIDNLFGSVFEARTFIASHLLPYQQFVTHSFANSFSIPTAHAADIGLKLEVKKVNEPSTYYTYIYLKDLPGQSKITVVRDGRDTIDGNFMSYTDGATGAKMLLGTDTYPPEGKHTYKVTVYDSSNGVLGEDSKEVTVPSGSYIPSSKDPDTPNESSIKQALGDPNGWVLKAWKTILGLADVFIVIVLLFLALTNILHIQYDTYAIKKSLPTLIIGVILANFSIFITKMLVDAANALTATFTFEEGSAGAAANHLITELVPKSGSIIGTSDVGWFTLLIAIFFSFFVIIVFMILGFLFYIRYIVILALTVVAPLAFVLMAFPPTQGFFKQWASWYFKFIFMKPVSFFLLYLASEVLAASRGPAPGITVWALVVFLVIAAIIVPFKMGGAVMSAWGGLGKKGAGLAGKGLSKATEVQRAKMGNWFANTRIGRWQQGRQLELDTLKAEREGIKAKHEAAIRKKKGSRQTLREREVDYAKGELEAEKMAQTLAVEEGKFNHISKRQMRKITGERDPMDVAQKYIEQANRLKQAEEGLTKRRDLDLQVLSVRDLRKDKDFRDGLKEMQEKGGIEIDADYSEDGNMLAAGTARTKLTYDRAIEVAEELRFKAKSETDATKRAEIEQAANHFDQKAKDFQNTHKTFTHGGLAGKAIDYDYYLSRNLGGRRQKILNPALMEEAKVQVMSNSHTDLVKDTTDPTKTFGTSEWRARNVDYDKYIKGQVDQIDASAAYACLVQAHATHQVMETAKRGDIKGLETISLFTERVGKVRKNFKALKSLTALKTMDPNTRDLMEKKIAEDYGGAGTTWASLSAKQKVESINKLDFTKLELKGMGRDSTAQRNFLDRFLTQVELDEKLGLSASPGAMLRK